MTIVRLCVRPSVRPSFRATGILSPQLLMSFIGLILNFVDYVMKMCMNVSFKTFFDGVMSFYDPVLVSAASAISLID